MSAFAQSFLVLDNGITITTDTAGYAYDFGHFAYPQKILLKGGQYFGEEGGILATIDDKGLLYRKYEVLPTAIKGKGMNYFIAEDGTLFTIDSKGAVAITKDEVYTKALNFGGNYFTVAQDPERTVVDLFVVGLDGKATKAVLTGFTMKEVVSYGGSYFMTNRGVLYTIAANGTVAPQPSRVGLFGKRGGNYFTDSSNLFYTVAQDGSLKMPALPINLRVTSIYKTGSNYFLDLSGRLYVVDKEGNVFERSMRDHDFRNARIISL